MNAPVTTTSKQILLLFCFTLLIAKTGLQGSETLAVARDLVATKYKNWTYGTDSSKKQVDCVQFVLAVVAERLKQTPNEKLRKAILIDHGWSPEKTQKLAAENTDARLDGVVYALTQLSNFGERVKPSDAKPGDIVQYWMKNSKGWFGHAGVIESVEGARAVLMGAHASPKPDGTIGKSPFKLNLIGKDRRVAVVRIEDA